ncbi:MAG: phosphoribosylamine--glycine ligase, partial [Candidatus Eisenbacteria bacterium]|nr:phosphoribosylamine--glycine ligase [Candidatus Latescibacterota bacterium]MBD3301113.1 phosphoribosylamine--glycine ligase [Candidatus Eisenbacteria bacterium]
RSPRRPTLLAAPGNAGTAAIARNVPIRADAIEELVDFAAREACDLTVVGPEAPLVAGIVDRFRSAGLPIFGPDRRAAALEGSKVFAKDLMRRNGIPTAPYETFYSSEFAVEALRNAMYPKVIKADGLAAGKGVTVAAGRDEAIRAVREIMVERRFGAAGERIIVEEFLDGEEMSVFALCRGTDYFLLPTSQDHKRLQDGDTGPNTGGMGAYAPFPGMDAAFERRVREEIVEPTLRAMDAEGRPYRGLLYFGLIIQRGRPYVLEYNCRFGDPETQAVLPLVEGDLLEALETISGDSAARLPSLRVREGAAAVVVLASDGYPMKYEKGFPIRGVEEAETLPGVTVFHAGTKAGSSGPLTDGGRVLGVTGTGRSLREALGRAYEGASMIEFENKIHRTDIGRRALSR